MYNRGGGDRRRPCHQEAAAAATRRNDMPKRETLTSTSCHAATKVVECSVPTGTVHNSIQKRNSLARSTHPKTRNPQPPTHEQLSHEHLWRRPCSQGLGSGFRVWSPHRSPMSISGAAHANVPRALSRVRYPSAMIFAMPTSPIFATPSCDAVGQTDAPICDEPLERANARGLPVL
jgi:hypothetical protein